VETEEAREQRAFPTVGTAAGEPCDDRVDGRHRQERFVTRRRDL
jgi:hypothetical protein